MCSETRAVPRRPRGCDERRLSLQSDPAVGRRCIFANAVDQGRLGADGPDQAIAASCSTRPAFVCAQPVGIETMQMIRAGQLDFPEGQASSALQQNRRLGDLHGLQSGACRGRKTTARRRQSPPAAAASDRDLRCRCRGGHHCSYCLLCAIALQCLCICTFRVAA